MPKPTIIVLLKNVTYGINALGESERTVISINSYVTARPHKIKNTWKEIDITTRIFELAKNSAQPLGFFGKDLYVILCSNFIKFPFINSYIIIVFGITFIFSLG